MQAVSITMSSDVLYQELDGEAVLLHLKSEEYYSIKESGVRMWQLLSQHGNKHAVIDQLVAEYDVDRATIESDLSQLLAWLSDRDLVHIS